MRPAYKITSEQQDLTASFVNNFISMRISDESGIESDTLEISLSDNNSEIVWPEIGRELEIYIGYDNEALTKTGLYIVDEVQHSSSPDTLVIRAKAIDTTGNIKAQKTRSWHERSIGEIVEQIASDNEIDFRISADLEDIVLPHIDQTEESDLHFIYRLADQNGAMAKLANSTLIVALKNDSRTISGLPLPTVTVNRDQCINYRITQAERGKYKSAIAHWHNTVSGDKEPVSTGDEKPAYILRHTFPDAEQALRAAQDKLDALNRGTASFSLSIIGNPKIQPEAKIQTEGFRNPLNALWLVKRVQHELGPSGFITRIDTETPSL